MTDKIFEINWIEEVYKNIRIRAKNEKDAKKIFFSHNFNPKLIREENIEFVDDSFEIEEVKK